MPSLPAHTPNMTSWLLFISDGMWNLRKKSATYTQNIHIHTAAIWSVSLCFFIADVFLYVSMCMYCQAVMNLCVCVFVYHIVCTFIQAEIETVGV